ncbi:hypothetical protein GTU71_14030 [Rathayibacter sp. VKM Ac-2762]|uniref:hypothetical protein n=1 Tax=Rathayibacter sp. VKM Ac-2762 TaxID=2609254 RepID=UPI00132ED13A|nr:hypothetical protein [Rathayibacter sp. VKM Ac-2762]QHF21845.1 hypothetical protein GTU71_14030 [Rathayibacter sp. VKM Ac-2762]
MSRRSGSRSVRRSIAEWCASAAAPAETSTRAPAVATAQPGTTTVPTSRSERSTPTTPPATTPTSEAPPASPASASLRLVVEAPRASSSARPGARERASSVSTSASTTAPPTAGPLAAVQTDPSLRVCAATASSSSRGSRPTKE